MKICMIYFIAAVGLSVGVSAASGQSLSEDLKLVASDGEEFDHFGRSISIENGVVVVGADFDDGFGTGSGSVYLFEASTGTQIEKLIPKDGQAGDHFGYSVDVHNGIVAIGARLNDERANDAGAAYLFDGSTGMQLFKFVASDGGSGDWLGGSIAIDNGVVAVGATRDDDRGQQSGSVYLFDATTGAELFKLTASDGGAGDAFGHSIGIHNGIVVVGAYGNDHEGGNSAGAAYLFDVSTGVQLMKLTAEDGQEGDQFGISVEIENEIVAVGASGDDDFGSRSGSAYLFDASTGEELFKLNASDGGNSDLFGSSIAIDSGIVAVGSVWDDNLVVNSGSVYIFDSSTGEELARLAASDGELDGQFGSTISIENRLVFVGAHQQSALGLQSGSAYVFDVGCRVDMNNDFALNFYDVSAFFGLFVAGDLVVDFNDDGNLNFGDVSIFIAEFGQGCPLVN